jgi:hypothetical protein
MEPTLDVKQEKEANGDHELPRVPYDLTAYAFIEWAVTNAQYFANDSGKWESALWPFTRLLKGHADLMLMDGWDAIAVVEHALFGCSCMEPGRRIHANHWYEIYERLGDLNWGEPINFDDDEEARMVFVAEWEAVRHPYGWAPLDVAIERAARYPLLLPKTTTEGYIRFVSIAAWLQYTMGDRPVLLPVEKLARRLNVSMMAISRYRQKAVRDGYIILVRPHVHRPGGKGSATEFRVTIDQCAKFDPDSPTRLFNPANDRRFIR